MKKLGRDSMWLDDIAWYYNILGNITCFYFIFYMGYWAGKNNLLRGVSEDYGEKLP